MLRKLSWLSLLACCLLVAVCNEISGRELNFSYSDANRSGDHIWYIRQLPTGQLCPVRQVKILANGIRLPAASAINGCPPPHSAGAVKVEQQAALTAGSLLDDKMTVEGDGLGAGKGGGFGVKMSPARLYHTYMWVGKMRHYLPQKDGRRYKIGVENGNKVAGGAGQPKS